MILAVLIVFGLCLALAYGLMPGREPDAPLAHDEVKVVVRGGGAPIAPVAASNTVMAPIGSCALTLTADEAVSGATKALEGFGDG